jgi:Thiolase, C-terminal domain
LHKVSAVLTGHRCWVANVHDCHFLFEFDASLTLQRGQKSGTQIALTVNRNGHRATVFGHNVVAAVDTVKRPARRPQFTNYLKRFHQQIIYLYRYINFIPATCTQAISNGAYLTHCLQNILSNACRHLLINVTAYLHEMARHDAHKGLVSLCVGSGMGVALTIER